MCAKKYDSKKKKTKEKGFENENNDKKQFFDEKSKIF